MMAKRQDKKSNGNGANLGFEQTLWLAADKLRNNLDAAEYKHVVLGLIFLKYISDAFAEVYAKLTGEKGEGADAEDPDEYPPDLQAEATTLVLEQAEALCADWAA
jgi:type I restriction-modification system DNA methylase subunit